MEAANQNSPKPAVFLLTRIGNDARNAAAVLGKAGMRAEICATMGALCALCALCEQAGEKTGALVIGEEILDQKSLARLSDFLGRQPPWSDMPIILLTAAGEIQPQTYRVLDFLGARANVTLLEKPLRVYTLISVVKTALRSRNRQYEVRHLLESQETLVRQRTAKLQETVGELEAFSYSIAHDMRAPLRSLQGFAQILLTDHGSQLDANGRKYLSRIAGSAERMDKLIRDVLNYSRVVSSELALEMVDVESLLRGIVETYPMFAPDKADVELEGPFPPVLGNEAILTQIFSNLMGNGVKFVPPGVKPRLRVWSESKPSVVRLFVQDNGIGIAADQQERIFGIFQKVHKSFDGTGIGLAIVKKAVERIGGKVCLESELAKGSTFWIEVRPAKSNNEAS
ncbi:MAG TPA: ATP-binding protein [Verrucomicrobiae bacterium]|jgi:signal transduction histidine kinase